MDEIWASDELIEATKDGIEIWRPVLGAEGKYDVSNFGQVRNAKSGVVLVQATVKLGYKIITLLLANRKRRCTTIQFLMAEAFIGPRPGALFEWEAAHEDGSKDNNRLDNIAWKTRKRNNEDRVKHGTTGRRECRVVDGVKNYQCTLCASWKRETEFRVFNRSNSACKRSSACLECGRKKDRERQRQGTIDRGAKPRARRVA